MKVFKNNGSVAAAAAAALGLLAVFAVDIGDAEACTGSPPPPQCGVSLTCSTGVNKAFTSDLNVSTTGEVYSAVVLQITGNDPRCPAAQAQAQVNYQIDCLDMEAALANPQEPSWERVGSGSLNTSIQHGLNRLTVPVTMDPGATRRCELTGDVAVQLSTGQTATTECISQDLCLGPASDQMSGPAVDLELISEEPVYRAAPGEPKLLTYRITNNSTRNFAGGLSARSENPTRPVEISELPPPDPNPDDVCPSTPPEAPEEALDCSEEPEGIECGCDGQAYFNSCMRENAGVAKFHDGACEPPPLASSTFSVSDPGGGSLEAGIGDNFPLAWADEASNLCIPMPENPALTMDVNLERSIHLGPGESIEVSLIKRSWDLCSDGSCSQTRVLLSGALADATGSQVVVACGGASLVVDQIAVYQADNPSEPYDCPDTGAPPTVGVWIDPLEPPPFNWELPHHDDSRNHVPDWVEELFGYDPDAPLTTPEPTTEISFGLNLEPDAPVFDGPFTPDGPFNYTEPVLIYDSEGNPIPAVIHFRRTDDGEWEYHVVADGAFVDGAAPGEEVVILDGTLRFDANGDLSEHIPGQRSFNPANGAPNQIIDLFFDDTTQHHLPYEVSYIFANGSGLGDFLDTFGISQEELNALGTTSFVDILIRFGTDEEVFEIPFDPNNPYSTSNFSRTFTIYDSEGNPIDAEIFFQRSDDGTWEYFVLVDGADVAGGTPGEPTLIFDGALHFDADGNLTSHQPGLTSFDPANGEAGQSIDFNFDGSQIYDGPTRVIYIDPSPGPMEAFWTHLENQDSSGNGIPDIVQVMFGFAPDDPMDGEDLNRYSPEMLRIMDEDRDGLSDYDEIYVHRTSPINPDTDGDGVSDGAEVLIWGTDPLHPDTDRGGLSDGTEIAIGLDPLDPSDDHDAAGAPISSTPMAGVIFVSPNPNLSTVMRKNASTFGSFSPDVRAQARPFSQQIGRIEELVNFDAPLAANSSLEITVPFDAFPLLGSSPYEVNRVEIGKKAQHPAHLGRDLSGAGYIRLSSSPYTVFEFLYQASIWAISPATGASERLKVEDFHFFANSSGYTLEFTVEMPDFAVDELLLLHDFNAHESKSFVEVCNDGVDNNGNGLVDCDDPYCSDDPACGGGGDPTNPGDGNGDGSDDGPGDGQGDSSTGDYDPYGDGEFGDLDAEDDGSGFYIDNSSACGCYGAGGGPPPAEFLLTLLALAAYLASRRRKEDLGESTPL